MATEEVSSSEADRLDYEAQPLLPPAGGEGETPTSNYRSINRPNESFNRTDHSARSVESLWTFGSTLPGHVTLDEQQLVQLSEALKAVHDIIHAAQHQTTTSSMHRRRKRYLLPVWLTADFFLFTSMLQLMVVAVLTIVDGVYKDSSKEEKDTAHLIVNIVMTVVQGLNLLLVIAATIKLAKQIVHHSASFWFLIQCYLSTVVLYAGLYALVYRFDPSCFKNFDPFSELKMEDKRDVEAILVFLKALYFSISTATLCGASSIDAQALYSTILVGSQMLLSFVYFASILSEAITVGRPKKRSRPGLVLRLYYLLKKIFDKVMNAVCSGCTGCCVASDED